MADRYWVGGAGTWDASSTTNWATSSGGASGASAPTSADNVFFDSASNATAYAVAVAATAVCANLTIAGPATGNVTFNFGTNTLTVYGSFAGPATGLTWGTTGTIKFAATSGTQTITTNGVTMGVEVTVDGAGGTFTQQDALTTSFTYTFLNGTYNQNNFNLTCLVWNSGIANANRVYNMGTGEIFITGNNAYMTFVNGSGLTVTGSRKSSLTYAGSSGTRTWLWVNVAEANSVSAYFTAGTDATTSYPTSGCLDLNFVGYTGTYTAAGLTVFGNLAFGTGMTVASTTEFILLGSVSGSKTITSNGVAVNCQIDQNDLAVLPGATYTLTDNLTLGSTRSYIFRNGVLDLNGKTLSLGIFNTNSITARNLAFNGGIIQITGNNASVVTAGTLTGFTYTGTPTFQLTYSGSTGTRTIDWGTVAGGTEANAVNFAITAGSDIITTGSSNNPRLGSLIFTGFSGTWGGGNCIMVGDLTLSPTMSYTASAAYLRFYKTSGTQNITTNGVLLDVNLLQLATGATVKLLDNLTIGAAKEFNLFSGTLDLDGKTLTAATFVSTTGTNRVLAFGSNGKMVFTGSGASVFVAAGSNQTLTGTGTISMTSASAKTFAGGGFAYPALSQDGAGTLTISGNNTFANIANTVTPATVILPASGTQTCAAFSLAGTAGNLVTVNSGTSGVRATISIPSSTVDLNYCSFKDIAVSGGVFFKALVSNGCVEGTNTTGIVYAGPSQMVMVN